ncbi:MAG: hypothetical protein IJ660_04990, partial [Alphaproteobacteria bacterium]|nr:hypothetical protein [Alphaproteobacteria bacterium]
GKRVRQGGAGETEVSPHLRRRSGGVKRSQSKALPPFKIKKTPKRRFFYFKYKRQRENSGKRVQISIYRNSL